MVKTPGEGLTTSFRLAKTIISWHRRTALAGRDSRGTRLTPSAELFSLRPLVSWRVPPGCARPVHRTKALRPGLSEPARVENQLHPIRALMSAHSDQERLAVARVLKSPQAWDDLRRRAAVRLLKMHFESGVGHIGGNLSCLDLMLVLHHEVLDPDDQFVLSKGHCGRGLLRHALDDGPAARTTTCASFTRTAPGLSGHPPASGIEEILFATGSLGHGLSLAAGPGPGQAVEGGAGPGLLSHVRRRVERGLVLGSTDLRPHHRLENLTIAGRPQRPAGLRHDARGRRSRPAGGRSSGRSASRPRRSTATTSIAIGRRIATPTATGPDVIVARTHKGCGVSFMEDRMEWHYLPMTESQYLQAVRGNRASMRNAFCQALVDAAAPPGLRLPDRRPGLQGPGAAARRAGPAFHQRRRRRAEHGLGRRRAWRRRGFARGSTASRRSFTPGPSSRSATTSACTACRSCSSATAAATATA